MCQKIRSEPVQAPVNPWTFPSKPWSGIHIDFAGPISGTTYLVVVDAYSKFSEVVKMTSTTSTATTSMLYEIYLVVVAFLKWFPIMDHSSLQVSFTEQFCRNNGIMHRTSAAYKPSTNGQAEPAKVCNCTSSSH